MFLRHGGKQVARERRNAALARQVVAKKRYLADFRGLSQQFRTSTAFGKMPNLNLWAAKPPFMTTSMVGLTAALAGECGAMAPDHVEVHARGIHRVAA